MTIHDHNERAIELTAQRWIETFDSQRDVDTPRSDLDTRNLMSYLLAMVRRQGAQLNGSVTPNRNIRETIKQIIPLIPADLPEDQSDDDYIELRDELVACASDWFSAPEIEMPLWIGVATSLEQWLEKPRRDWPDWKWQVLAIFSGQDEATLRASLTRGEARVSHPYHHPFPMEVFCAAALWAGGASPFKLVAGIILLWMCFNRLLDTRKYTSSWYRPVIEWPVFVVGVLTWFWVIGVVGDALTVADVIAIDPGLFLAV